MARTHDVTGRIQERLSHLDSLSQAQQLFSDMNYEPVVGRSGILDYPDWPAATRDSLAEGPRVIARHGGFQIIYSRLNKGRLDRTTEREVVNRLARRHPYALYLFSDQDGSEWHFVNAKYDDQETRQRILRRFTVGTDERSGGRLRTVSEQLSEVALPDDELERLEREPLTLQQRYDRAFDVEVVTREFYKEYHRVFAQAEQRIKGFAPGEEERKRLFTQRLFNRLMFIAFIQKKGWLRLPGQQGTDYLSALWAAYQADRRRGEASNFYRDRLTRVFECLNDHASGGLLGNRPGGFMRRIVGDVPYLNGGLFEEEGDDKRPGLVVPDDALRAVLNDLFDRFNFTIAESTPLDVEVAVDPEMLGKVFEELVTGRHESGSYYTPKPIVSFMCREALKGYLGTALAAEPAEALERFVDEHDPAALRDPEAALNALRRVRACDPACGSGAYLLGLLHELLDLRQALFSGRHLDPKTSYQRKLEVIENNLYGVDIDPFAINIARLRLWLSLAVDFEGATPEPLPNLDFKVETGDSVLGTIPSARAYAQDMLRTTIARYVQLKDDYLQAHDGTKRRLRQEIEAAQRDIALWAHGGAAAGGFDWVTQFAEVFAGGGFDIILANPPYVRQEAIKARKPALKSVYGDLFDGTADLYVFFYYRALQLLKPGGMLVFISSNKWFRAGYGKKLRAHIARTTAVRSITDFGDLPVFPDKDAYPMIFVAQKGGEPGPIRFTEVESLEPPYPDMKALIARESQLLSPAALDCENWTLAADETRARLQVMSKGSTTLGEYVHGQIYYGIKTGFNQAFVIDGKKRAELIAADPRSAEIIKPLVVGKDIKKWRVDYKDRWLIVTKVGVDIKRYPAVFAHLKQWQDKLEKRCDKGNYWWELRPCDYYELFDRPKIVYQVFQVRSAFAYDNTGMFMNNSLYMIPCEDLYLLGVLNSDPFWQEIRRHCTRIQNGYQLMRDYFMKTLVPGASLQDRREIGELAQRCTELLDAAELEAEISARVARLYGLKGE